METIILMCLILQSQLSRNRFTVATGLTGLGTRVTPKATIAEAAMVRDAFKAQVHGD
jgi:hypothetical protein